jgi:hypothetical protein
MAQADSVYITPPTNTSAIDHPMMFPPRDPTRRRFLTVAAGASIASAGALVTAAAMPPSVPAAVPCLAVPAVLPDPAFALIAEKLAADIAHGEAIDAQDTGDTPMGMQYLHEIAEKVHDLQEQTRQAVEPEKLRAVVSLALELVREVQNLDDRVRALEGKLPRLE